MKLLTPDIGLLAWTALAFFSVILLIVASISLVRNKTLEGTSKLMWALIIIFVPIIGSILYFTNGRQKKIV